MTRPAVPAWIPPSQAGFLDDLGRTVDAWRRAPLLPVLTLAVAGVQLLAGSSNPGVGGAAALLGLLLVGWPGAERLWYLRLWTGRTLSVGEAWRATLRCFGRFFVLGLVVVAAAAVLAIPALIGVGRAAEFAPDGSATFPDGFPRWTVVYGVLLVGAGYAVLTFVTPALVYSSRRVRDAVPMGLRLLWRSWPHTAAYVLVPAVLGGVPGLFLGFGRLGATTALLTLATALVLALGRGAVAAFYVRTVPAAGPDGAVRLQPQPGYYPAPSSW